MAGTQTEIKSKITALTGEENCEKFYKSCLNYMITKRDINSLKAWGFNFIRLPIEKEPVAGQNTWLKTGFELTDKLLSWYKKNKMYLILDLHAAPGEQGNDRPIADVDTLKPDTF